MRRKISKQSRDENIAAIAAEFHGDKRRYNKFYGKYADHLSGFVGIWGYCVEAADAFTKTESDFPEDSYNWIDAVTSFVAHIFTVDLPTDNELRAIARQAIIAAKE